MLFGLSFPVSLSVFCEVLCWKSSRASVIYYQNIQGKLWETQLIRLKIPSEPCLICYWPTDWPKCHLIWAQLAVKNKNNQKKERKKERRIAGEWNEAFRCPSEHSSGSRSHKDRSAASVFPAMFSQTAAQCHLEEPRATWRENKTEGEKQPKFESHAGVTHISAGVHSGYQMVRGDICLEHMRTLWSSPGEKGGNMSLWLLILFLPTYLIPYWSYLGRGRGDVMQLKPEPGCLYRGRPSLLGSKESKKKNKKKRKIRSTVKCVEVVELLKISYLKVPSVEWRRFVLFCFNHQRSTVPSSSVTSLTLQVHSLQIYTLSSIFLPTERTLFAFGTPLSEKSNLAVLMSSLG